MKIAYPVTDYIPASLMTADGDLVTRYDGNIIRIGSGGHGRVLMSLGAGVNLTALDLSNALNTYMKGAGVAALPTFSPLALRDTGIHIGSDTRNAGGDQVIAGVGFESSLVLLGATDTTGANKNHCFGFDNGDAGMCSGMFKNGTESFRDEANSINIHRDINNRLEGVISAISGTGFTITWTLVGVLNLRLIYCCIP